MGIIVSDALTLQNGIESSSSRKHPNSVGVVFPRPNHISRYIKCVWSLRLEL
jgi:hypothetical protein